MNVSPTKWFGNNNMRHHPLVKCAHEDGTVVFQDRSLVRVDVIVQCTGYKYCFPFLEISDIVTVDDNCVGPLYQHIFPPVLAPGLSFIGLTWMVLSYWQYLIFTGLSIYVCMRAFVRNDFMHFIVLRLHLFPHLSYKASGWLVFYPDGFHSHIKIR